MPISPVHLARWKPQYCGTTASHAETIRRGEILKYIEDNFMLNFYDYWVWVFTYIYIYKYSNYLLHRLTFSSKLNVEVHANFVSWNRLHPRWQLTAHNRAECHQLQPRRWPWTWRQDETVKNTRKTRNGILFSFCWWFCLNIHTKTY